MVGKITNFVRCISAVQLVSRVDQLVTIQALFAISAVKDLEMDETDAAAAFLASELDEYSIWNNQKDSNGIERTEKFNHFPALACVASTCFVPLCSNATIQTMTRALLHPFITIKHTNPRIQSSLILNFLPFLVPSLIASTISTAGSNIPNLVRSIFTASNADRFSSALAVAIPQQQLSLQSSSPVSHASECTTNQATNPHIANDVNINCRPSASI